MKTCSPWLKAALVLLVICAVVFPFAIRVQAQHVEGTWCTQCNRLIPAGETCPHMGGSGSSGGGNSAGYTVGYAIGQAIGNALMGNPQGRRNEAIYLNNQGIEYCNQGEWELGAKAFAAALEKTPADRTIHNNL
jgi:hypothetical protein